MDGTAVMPGGGFTTAAQVGTRARPRVTGPVHIDANAASARIGARTRNGGEPAARITDKIQHSQALAGFLIGCVVGAAAGFLAAAAATAFVAATIATGGLALFAVGLVVGGAVTIFCEEKGKSIGSKIPGPVTGTVVTGANNISDSHVKINGLYAARAATPPPPKPNWFQKAVGAVVGFAQGVWAAVTGAGSSTGMERGAQSAAAAAAPFQPPNDQAPDFDKAACSQCGSEPRVGQGSEKVFINGQPASRAGDKVECGAKIIGGSSNVYIAGPQVTTLDIDDEIPLWAEVLGFVIGCINPIALVRGAMKLGVKGMVRGLAKGGGALLKGGARSLKGAGSLVKGFGKMSRGIINNPAKFISRVLDPVDPVTGAVVDERVDFSLPGPIPLHLIRTYKSNIAQRGLAGPGWMDNWSERIRIDGDDLWYIRRDGSQVYFRKPSAAKPLAMNLDAPHLVIFITEHGYIIEDKKQKLFFTFESISQSETYFTKISDYNENTIDISRDQQGYPTDIIDSAGTHIRVERDPTSVQFLLLHETQEPQKIAQYSFNERGQLTEVTGLEEGYFRYGYDEHNRLTWWGDANHELYRFRYDAEGRAIGGDGIRGFHIGHIEYNPENRTSIVHDSYGTTTYLYNGHNEIVETISPNGNISKNIFDDNNNLITSIDALNRETHFEYDQHGNTSKIIYPDGTSQQFEYDKDFNLIKEIGIDGNAVEYEVDTKHRVTSVTLPDKSKAYLEYTPHGFTNQIRLDDTIIARLSYSAKGLLQNETNALGATNAYQYDPLGQLTHINDPMGAVTRMAYARKSSGRSVLSSVVMPDGETTRYRHDAEGLLTSIEDGEGRITQNEYGPFDILEKTIFPGGETLTYEYDRETKLTAVINAVGERYTYDYNGDGAVIRETDFAGRKTTYKRDAVGNCIQKIAPDGAVTTYHYDCMDRLVCQKVFDSVQHLREPSLPTEYITYTYDPIGQLTQVANAHSTITFDYDAQGRVTRETQNGQTIDYTYNTLGQVVERKLPSGLTATYQWDQIGDLAAIQVGDAAPLSITRDADGRDVLRHTPAGFTEARHYTPGGKLHTQSIGRAQPPHPPSPGANGSGAHPLHPMHQTHRTYTWNRAFNPIGILDSHWGQKTFRYNANAQVSDVRHGGLRAGNAQATAAERFAYDARFNIAQAHTDVDGWAHLATGAAAGAAHGGARHYARGGLITDFIAGSGHRVQYAYDAAGRVIAKTEARRGFRARTTRYVWNGLDQLVVVHLPDGGAVRYRYDPFGRRIAKETTGPRPAHTAYLWDGATLAQEQVVRDGTTGVPVAWHFTDGAAPVARQTAAGVHYVTTDHLGTPKEMFAEDGMVTWRATHTLWGRLDQTGQQVIPANDTPMSCPHRFPGQYADDETGLHYNFYRYYDPDTGQYLSPDPIGLAGGHRPQAYVLSPSDEYDPLGLSVCAKFGKGFRANQAVARITDDIDAFANTAAKALDRGAKFQSAGRWGSIYQSWRHSSNPFKRHVLARFAKGNAVQEFVDHRLREGASRYLKDFRNAGGDFLSNQGHHLGFKNANGNLVRPDYQFITPNGGVHIVDITRPSVGAKLGKYMGNGVESGVNVLYSHRGDIVAKVNKKSLLTRWGDTEIAAILQQGKTEITTSPFGETDDGYIDIRGFPFEFYFGADKPRRPRGRDFHKPNAVLGSKLDFSFSKVVAPVIASMYSGFIDCKFIETNAGFHLYGGPFVRCDFTKSNFYRPEFNEITFEDNNFSNCKFRLGGIGCVKFVRCNFDNAIFNGPMISGTHFIDCTFEGAQFKNNAIRGGTVFEGSRPDDSQIQDNLSTLEIARGLIQGL